MEGTFYLSFLLFGQELVEQVPPSSTFPLRPNSIDLTTGSGGYTMVYPFQVSKAIVLQRLELYVSRKPLGLSAFRIGSGGRDTRDRDRAAEELDHVAFGGDPAIATGHQWEVRLLTESRVSSDPIQVSPGRVNRA